MTVATREQKTEDAYLNRAKGRLQAYLEDRGRDWDLYTDDFIAWLESYRDTISKPAWRQNRAALVWFMRNIDQNNDLASRIHSIGTFACTAATRTSANKKKSLSTKEYNAISEELLASHQRHINSSGSAQDLIAQNTLLFLCVTEMTGLRPSEWWRTTLFEPGDVDHGGNRVDIHTLVVKNGKSSNGRSHGQYRTLRFNDLDEERRLALVVHYRSVKQLQTEEAFDNYVKACKSRMTYTTRKLWPNRKRQPSLYSGRHQFSANLKKAQVPLSVLAALMGHATDRTATEHYGRKRYGRGNETGIEADPNEVDRIRQKAKPKYLGSVKDTAPEIRDTETPGI